jgi:hypothetical protein
MAAASGGSRLPRAAGRPVWMSRMARRRGGGVALELAATCGPIAVVEVPWSTIRTPRRDAQVRQARGERTPYGIVWGRRGGVRRR